MTLTQMLKAMIYVVPILSGIVLVVWLIIRQQNKEREALEAAMTQEQKDRLLQTRPAAAPAGMGGFVIEALVVEKTDKGAKYSIRLMWHNTVIPNNSLDKLMMTILAVPKDKADAANLQVGDYVRYWMDPEKQKWDILF